MLRIAIGSDHGGYKLKEQIKKHFSDYNWLDLGTNSEQSVDYPDYAHKMAKCLRQNQAELGILICGTGIGISIAANRHKGIRAALLYNQDAARLAKLHNNANVLVFGGRTMSVDDVIQDIEIFMQTEYEGGRHQKRLDKIETME